MCLVISFQEKFGTNNITNYNLVKFKVVWFNIWVKLELTVLFKKLVKFTRWAFNKKLLKSLKGEIKKVPSAEKGCVTKLLSNLANGEQLKL